MLHEGHKYIPEAHCCSCKYYSRWYV